MSTPGRQDEEEDDKTSVLFSARLYIITIDSSVPVSPALSVYTGFSHPGTGVKSATTLSVNLKLE